MFEDFSGKQGTKDRRRLGASLLASSVIYGAVFGSLVLASAAARKAPEKDTLVQVEFKPPPEPPPPPPPPEPAKPQKVASTAPARAKVERQELKAPDEIPDEKPEEAEGALPDAPAPGSGRDGMLTGVVGGTGTAAQAPSAPPPPKPVIVKPSSPIRNADTAMPEMPRSARRAGIEGTVVCRIYVRADGVVSKVDILEGPEVFYESVRTALMTWRYKPAQLSNGATVADTHIVRIPFKLN